MIDKKTALQHFKLDEDEFRQLNLKGLKVNLELKFGNKNKKCGLSNNN